MKDTFNEEVYLALPLEAQLKVEQIYNIANMLHVNRLPKLNSTEFDNLYDKPLEELEAITGYFRIRGHFRVIAENTEGE